MTVNIKESSEEKYLKYINSKKNRECEIILRMLGNYGPYNLTTKQIRNKTIVLLKSRDMCHLFDSPLNTDIFDEKIKKHYLTNQNLHGLIHLMMKKLVCYID